MDKQIFIHDVVARDGLQIEPLWVPTEQKIELIDRLSATGVAKIEATSFVSPKAIPQLADSGHADIKDAVFLPDLLPDTVRTLPDPAGNLGIEELPRDDVIDDGLRISQQLGGDHIVAFCSSHKVIVAMASGLSSPTG